MLLNYVTIPAVVRRRCDFKSQNSHISFESTPRSGGNFQRFSIRVLWRLVFVLLYDRITAFMSMIRLTSLLTSLH